MPGKVTDEFGNVLRIGRSGRDNSGAFALAIGNVADGAIGEKRVKLSDASLYIELFQKSYTAEDL